jgi:hypothetical protein
MMQKKRGKNFLAYFISCEDISKLLNVNFLEKITFGIGRL